MKNRIFFLFVLLLCGSYLQAAESEYCNYVHDANQPATTWQTDVNGNVVITMSDAAGATNASFRNGGFEGGIGAWVVLSGDGFTTSEPADNYFTREETSSTVFKLKLKSGVNLPSPCKIKFQTSAFSWKCDENDGAWKKPCEFTYTYGTNCAGITTPAISGISATGRLSFTSDASATSHTAYIYNELGVLVATQDVVTNDVLNIVPLSTGTYTVKVRSIKGDYASDMSAAYNWSVEAGHVYGSSAFCDYHWNTTDNGGWPIYMTWQTEPDGSITITIAPNGDQGDGVTAFRESTLTRMTVGSEAASTYFNGSYSGNVMTLSLKDPSYRPANGTIIHHNGAFCYKTGTHTNAWPTLNTNYVYGTKCVASDAVAPVITTFEKVSATTDAITFHVVASDEDDEGAENPLTYSVSGNNGFATQAVVLDASGNFTVSGLKKNIHYNFTLTATDPSGNNSTRDLDGIDTEFDPDYNIALLKPCTGGYCQFSDHTPEGDAVYHKRANDGNRDNSYSAYGAPEGEAWWQVDLGIIYNLSRIDVYFADDYSNNYQILGSFDGENWFEMASDAATASGLKSTSLNAASRYVKVFSVKRNVVFKEIEVYANGFATTDAVAPYVTVTKVATTTNTATLKIIASDEDDAGVSHPVKSITISGDNGFTTIENAVLDAEHNIVLDDLKDNTIYNFHILVTDRAGLTAEDNITIRVAYKNVNLALNKPSEAGVHQNANVASRANDGNESNFWTSFGQGTQEQWWWKVDLGQSFNVNRVRILFNDHNGTYNLLTSVDGTNWSSYAKNFTIDIAHVDYSINVVTSARYFKFTSTAANVGIKEFEVYGTGYDDGDTRAPSITAASLVGTAGEDNASISVTATDNVGVYAIRFVDAANAYNQTFEYVAGQNLTVTGLVPGTTYHFTLTAEDRAGNVSAAFEMSAITTTGNSNVPHVSAPVPTKDPMHVVSIYGNTYTSVVKDGYNWQAWNSSSTVEHRVINGNDYTLYQCGAGGEFGIGSNFRRLNNEVGIDVHRQEYFHIDIWTNEAWRIGITLNDGRLKLNHQLQAGWNSIDIPLTDLQAGGGLTPEEILSSLKWIKLTEVTNRILAVDNIYFWNYCTDCFPVHF